VVAGGIVSRIGDPLPTTHHPEVTPLGPDPGEPDSDGTRLNPSGVRVEGGLLAGRQEVGAGHVKVEPHRPVANNDRGEYRRANAEGDRGDRASPVQESGESRGFIARRNDVEAVGTRVWLSVAVGLDDHGEGHEFPSPGGPSFEAPAAPTQEGAPPSGAAVGHCWLVEGASASGAAVGHCWLVEGGGDGGTCAMLVLTTEGARRVDCLGPPLEWSDRLTNREGFDGPRCPEGSRVRRLA